MLTPRWVLALCLGAALALSAAYANADVVVRGDREGLDAVRLGELVRLELGVSTDVENVVIDLSSGHASVTIERRTGGTRSAMVELPSHGSGEIERTVALVVGELAREREAPAPAAPPPRPAAVEKPIRTEVAPRRIGPSVLAGARARVFGSGGALVVGPMIDAGIGLGERFRVSVMGSYGLAWADDPLGTVSAQIPSAGAAVAYRFGRNEGLTFDSGIALDVGSIRGSGEGSGARSSSGLGVAGAWFVEARAHVAGPVLLSVALEVGALAPGLDLRADDRTVLTISGPFAGLRLGLVVAP